MEEPPVTYGPPSLDLSGLTDQPFTPQLARSTAPGLERPRLPKREGRGVHAVYNRTTTPPLLDVHSYSIKDSVEDTLRRVHLDSSGAVAPRPRISAPPQENSGAAS